MPTAEARTTIAVPDLIQQRVQVQSQHGVTPLQPLLETLAGVPGALEALLRHFQWRVEAGHWIHLYLPGERYAQPFLRGETRTLEIAQVIYFSPQVRRGMSGCVLIERRDAGQCAVSSHT